MLSEQEYHVVIRPDAKHLPEVAESDGGICLEPEVSIVMSWCQVTPFTENSNQTGGGLLTANKKERECCVLMQ